MRIALLIARKDFLLNIRSVRFLICMTLCLLFVPFSIITGTDNYLRQVKMYNKFEYKIDTLLSQRHVWSEVRPITLKKPETLSIFSQGINNNIGMINKIYINDYPTFPAISQGTPGYYNNSLLNAFSFTDLTGILGIILSLMAFAFAYNTFTQEKEDGMLRMIFSEPVHRSSFIIGKLLGIFFTLFPVVIFCYALAIGYLVYSDIHLGAIELNGILLLCLLSLLYVALFTLAGTFISSLFHHSQPALVICFLCWIGIVFIIPPSASYLSQMIIPLRDYKNMNDELGEIDNKLRQKFWHVRDSLQKLRKVEGYSAIFEEIYDDGHMDEWGMNREYAHCLQEVSGITSRMSIEAADKKWIIKQRYLKELIRQQKLKQWLSALSPMQVYTNAIQNICRTSPSYCLEYMAEERSYRHRVINFFLENKLFDSLSYISTNKEEELLSREEYEKERKNLDIYDQALHDSILRLLELRPYLDTSAMPRFHQTPPSIDRQWEAAIPVMSFFILFGALFMYLLIKSSNSYDIR